MSNRFGDMEKPSRTPLLISVSYVNVVSSFIYISLFSLLNFFFYFFYKFCPKHFTL